MKDIIDALCDTFTEDPSTPSVVLSRLENGNYYGSLVRYSESFGKGKQVLYKCEKETPELVLNELRTQLGLPNG